MGLASSKALEFVGIGSMSGGVLSASVSGGVTGAVDLSRSLSTLQTFFCVYRDTGEHVHKDDFPLA